MVPAKDARLDKGHNPILGRAPYLCFMNRGTRDNPRAESTCELWTSPVSPIRVRTLLRNGPGNRGVKWLEPIAPGSGPALPQLGGGVRMGTLNSRICRIHEPAI